MPREDSSSFCWICQLVLPFNYLKIRRKKDIHETEAAYMEEARKVYLKWQAVIKTGW